MKTKTFSRVLIPPAAEPKRFRFADLIVILVIAVVLGYLGVKYFGNASGASSRQETAKVFVTQDINNALQIYKNDTGSFPTTRQGLKALVEQPDGMDSWKGPYLDASALSDPWSIPYQYAFPSKHNGVGKYDVWSMGPDKMSGTKDDVGNW